MSEMRASTPRRFTHYGAKPVVRSKGAVRVRRIVLEGPRAPATAARRSTADEIAWSPTDTTAALRSAGAAHGSHGELTYLRARGARQELQHLVGRSAKMGTVFRAVRRLAAQWSNAALLVRGEMGTGKTAIARAIHLSGRRAKGPLIELDCADTDDLMQAQLFGDDWTHARRDGRGGLLELAHGGTLLLDRVDYLPLVVQRRLLAWVGPRPVARNPLDVQLVATTQRDLDFMAQQGLFLPELVRHFSPVVLPPLRKREADAIELAELFLREFARRYRQEPKQLSDGARFAIEHYRWPANVRELRNAIERVVLVEDSPIVDVEVLCLRDERIHRRLLARKTAPAEIASRDLGRVESRPERADGTVVDNVVALGAPIGGGSIDTTYCMINKHARRTSKNAIALAACSRRNDTT